MLPLLPVAKGSKFGQTSRQRAKVVFLKVFFFFFLIKSAAVFNRNINEMAKF